MIARDIKKPSTHHQYKMLGITRSSVYYRPRPIKPEDLKLMRLIDEQYLKTPCYGSRHIIFLVGLPSQAAGFIAVVSIIPNHLLVLAGDMGR